MKNAIKAAMLVLTLTAATSSRANEPLEPSFRSSMLTAEAALSAWRIDALTASIMASVNPRVFMTFKGACRHESGRRGADIRVDAEFGLTCLYAEKGGIQSLLMPRTYRMTLAFAGELNERGIAVEPSGSALVGVYGRGRFTDAEIGAAINAAYRRFAVKCETDGIESPF